MTPSKKSFKTGLGFGHGIMDPSQNPFQSQTPILFIDLFITLSFPYEGTPYDTPFLITFLLSLPLLLLH